MAFIKPRIEISIKLPGSRANDAGILLDKLRPAVDKLSTLEAWPTYCGTYSIHIVDELSKCVNQLGNERDDPVTGILTRWHRNTAAPMNSIRRRIANPMDICISVDFLAFGGAVDLANFGAKEEEIIFHALAHEIHHLDEAERMMSCGLDVSALGLKLARAIRPELPLEFRDALKKFSELHNEKALGIDGVLKKAGDVADECCADLTGLHWLRQAENPITGNWRKFANALVAFRQADFQNNPHAYDMAGELSQFMSKPDLPSLSEIHALTATAAINVAKGSSKLDPGVKYLFENIVLPPVMGEVGKPPSVKRTFLGRLFGK